ncbi:MULTISPECIES: hypothetical protein [unclassified Marinobacterium]|jgi:hypothetical protein|uniref:hypothetical protein n=1 Tax=unclassified Marinobacterium TaxID=2644139 RepID=UPI0015690547|nr:MULTISPECIES: hypothetical protein [unclassified Marinobacterium]NRP46353.1 hypothetical protein [Marinobacterium sp. xm-d-543]NRQ22689.1 hypothetical protein [Marinobacterium sp. xm-m-312]
MSLRALISSLTGNPETSLPDDFVLEDKIPAETVISRNADGNAVSTYGDPIWDISYKGLSGSAVFYFDQWDKTLNDSDIKEEITDELKRIQYYRLNLRGRNGKVRQPQSVRIDATLKLARIALSCSISMTKLLSVRAYNNTVFTHLKTESHNSLKDVKQTIEEIILCAHDNAYELQGLKTDNAYLLIDGIKALISRSSRAYKNAQRHQHFVIPTRIYADVIDKSGELVDNFNSVRFRILDLYQTRFEIQQNENLDYAANQNREARPNEVMWQDAIKEHDLTNYIETYQINDMQELSSHLKLVQSACSVFIQIFSGMRVGEVRKLSSNPFFRVEVDTTEVFIIKGYTHKAIGGGLLTGTHWITADFVESSVQSAQVIGRIAGLLNDYDLEKCGTEFYPLFPSLKYNPSKTRKNTSPSNRLYAAAPISSNISDRFIRYFKDLDCAEIVKEDIGKIALANRFQDLTKKGVIVGEKWPLKTHQFRRSLAAYSARSGLVTVGDTKYQFQHLFEDMSLYYRSGSLYVENFIDSETEDGMALEELIADMQMEFRIAQFESYEATLLGNDRLFGGEGTRLQRIKDRGEPLIITTDRETTYKNFIEGRMVYKQGPLGGCTNINNCDKLSLTVLGACAECSFSVCDSRSIVKVERELVRLKKMQSRFKPDSSFHKQIQSEIDVLERTIDKQKPKDSA